MTVVVMRIVIDRSAATSSPPWAFSIISFDRETRRLFEMCNRCARTDAPSTIEDANKDTRMTKHTEDNDGETLAQRPDPRTLAAVILKAKLPWNLLPEWRELSFPLS